MKNLLKLAFATFASLRTISEGKTLVLVNLPEPNELTNFKNNFFPAENVKNDEVNFLTNPFNEDAVKSELSSEIYHTIALHSHGGRYLEIPIIYPFSSDDSFVPFTDFVDIINKNNERENIKTIHISSCHIGRNFNQLANPNSPYYQELNNSLKNNQLLFFHGDEYTGETIGSYDDRLKNLISNKNYSIIEALLDSGEALNVVFKANDQLKIHQTKSFGRNNEEWKIENYRKHLLEEAKKAKKFEVENNILDEDETRIDVEKLTDKDLQKSLDKVFLRYFVKLLDEKNYEKINELIEKKPNLNSRNRNGWTALMFAIREGHVETVNLLLKAGADVNLRENHGWTPLMIAIREGHTEIVNSLIKAGANVNLQENDGWTALMFATDNGHTEMVNSLIKAGANVNLQNKNGLTALMIAAHEGRTEMVNSLIEARADLNLQENGGWTALMFAIREGRVETVNLLLKAGANVNLQENGGWTALMFATDDGHTEMVNSLIKAGAKLNLQNNNGWTALMFAVAKDHKNIFKFLLEAGADVNLQENKGNTALMYAVHEGHVETVNLLLAAGADVNLQGNDGNTALMYAVHESNAKIVNLLLEAGANVNLQYKDGSTALMFASRIGNKEIANLIKEKSDKNLSEINNLEVCASEASSSASPSAKPFSSEPLNDKTTTKQL